MSKKGWVLFAAMSVIWGIPYLLIKVAVEQLSPVALVGMRTAPAAVLLCVLAWRRNELSALRGRLRWVALFALVEMGIPWLLMGRAEQHLTSSLTGLIVAAVPLVAATISRFTHPDDSLGPRRLGGLALGTAGIVVLLGLNVTSATALPIFEMAIVVVGYATGPFIIATKLDGAPGVSVAGVAILFVAIAYFPATLLNLPHHLDAKTISAVVALSLICTAVAFVVFFALIVEVGPSRSTVVTYINPAVAVALGVILAGDPISTAIIIGFPMIIAGSVLATSRTQGATEPAALAEHRAD